MKQVCPLRENMLDRLETCHYAEMHNQLIAGVDHCKYEATEQSWSFSDTKGKAVGQMQHEQAIQQELT